VTHSSWSSHVMLRRKQLRQERVAGVQVVQPGPACKVLVDAW
jgi:hypothetical protein